MGRDDPRRQLDAAAADSDADPGRTRHESAAAALRGGGGRWLIAALEKAAEPERAEDGVVEAVQVAEDLLQSLPLVIESCLFVKSPSTRPVASRTCFDVISSVIGIVSGFSLPSIVSRASSPAAPASAPTRPVPPTPAVPAVPMSFESGPSQPAMLDPTLRASRIFNVFCHEPVTWSTSSMMPWTSPRTVPRSETALPIARCTFSFSLFSSQSARSVSRARISGRSSLPIFACASSTSAFSRRCVFAIWSEVRAKSPCASAESFRMIWYAAHAFCAFVSSVQVAWIPLLARSCWIRVWLRKTP